MGYVHRHGRAYDTLPFVPARARHSQWRTKAGGRRTQSQYRARIAVTSAPEGTLPRVCTAALCRFLVGAFTMHRVAVKKNPQKKMAGITTGIGWPVTRRLQQQQEMSTWWWWWTCLSWGPLFWTAVNFWHGDTVLQMIERCCEHKHSKYRQPSPRRARMLQSNTVSTNEIEIQRSETLNPAVSIPWSKSVLARLNKGSVPLQDSVP
jgi:hypothetical protein